MVVVSICICITVPQNEWTWVSRLFGYIDGFPLFHKLLVFDLPGDKFHLPYNNYMICCYCSTSLRTSTVVLIFLNLIRELLIDEWMHLTSSCFDIAESLRTERVVSLACNEKQSKMARTRMAKCKTARIDMFAGRLISMNSLLHLQHKKDCNTWRSEKTFCAEATGNTFKSNSLF